MLVAVELATGSRTSSSAGLVPEHAGITKLKMISKGKKRRIGFALNG